MPKSKNSVSHFHVKTIQIRNFLKKYTVGIEVASSSKNGIFAFEIIRFHPISVNNYAIYHVVNPWKFVKTTKKGCFSKNACFVASFLTLKVVKSGQTLNFMR